MTPSYKNNRFLLDGGKSLVKKIDFPLTRLSPSHYTLNYNQPKKAVAPGSWG